ncbi:hypothetical protein [Polynucleobacter sp. MG-27-Goln-C1]|uniref:hypothetical protein n=1 Tax=Polynucleobacter sp. MG-27-Goln-C1 TaxID=1819726 RepID=UPI001C0E5D61|nr:hypothetical protein [Polynucleobacter sp. MG-27-Goln-C1]MBU3612153.1 hypothetical protein [Polynucleobacter sp. MG-27-Goln-C1]
MLTEEKKSLIQAEERYRHEMASKIRSELGILGQEVRDIERGIWDKVNEFLNSNVGMWLLSTVLVTGGAGAYQTMQHHYEMKLRNRTQLITHQFEIANRIQNMKYFLRKAQTIGDAQLALKSVFLSKTPVNPDVEKLSLSVIYFNFYQMLGAQNKEALELVRKLEDQEYILQSEKASDPLPDAEKQKLLGWVDALEQIELKESHTR